MSARLDEHEQLLRRVSEAAFTRQVVGLARFNGWLVHHSRPAMMRSGKWATALMGHAGLPDLILLKGPWLVFAELKRQAGGVDSPGQLEWGRRLQRAGVEFYRWRPGDMDSIKQRIQRRETHADRD